MIPPLTAALPRVGPTICSATIFAGALVLPDFKILARSCASSVVKLPEISELPPSIGPFTLGADFVKKSMINANIKDKDLEKFSGNDNTAMFRGGATYADAITFGSDVIEKKLVDEFSKVKGKKTVPFKGWDSDLTEYLELYNDLAGK